MSGQPSNDEGEGEDSSGESRFEYDPISRHQLHEFNKSVVPDGIQVRKNATKLMKQRLTNSADILIRLANEKRKERDGGRVNEDDVQKAFNEAFRPYTLVDDLVAVIEEYEYELKREAEKTMILDFEEKSLNPNAESQESSEGDE